MYKYALISSSTGSFIANESKIETMCDVELFDNKLKYVRDNEEAWYENPCFWNIEYSQMLK